MFSNFHATACACGDVPSYFAGHLCSAISTNSLVLAQQLRRSQTHRYFSSSKEISRTDTELLRRQSIGASR
jgi:hypothetical protein